ncbi:MAG: transcription elongation factor GreA [Phycisphaerales bacterium]|nr:transcription elongation factor GreA [Phycisphaerales bacterium]
MSQHVTKETFEKMKDELQRMKSIDRPAASKAIAEAREKGDLRENAEYDSAKEAQGLLEAKIKQLEIAISSAIILDPSKVDVSKATLLTKITITRLNDNKVFTYQLVGDKDANIDEMKLSISSPIGKGLLGRQVGEVAQIKMPNGSTHSFRIDNITL